jgi:hypothetical protein
MRSKGRRQVQSLQLHSPAPAADYAVVVGAVGEAGDHTEATELAVPAVGPAGSATVDAGALPGGSIFSTMRLWFVYTQMSPAIFIERRTICSAVKFGWSISAVAAAARQNTEAVDILLTDCGDSGQMAIRLTQSVRASRSNG